MLTKIFGETQAIVGGIKENVENLDQINETVNAMQIVSSDKMNDMRHSNLLKTQTLMLRNQVVLQSLQLKLSSLQAMRAVIRDA